MLAFHQHRARLRTVFAFLDAEMHRHADVEPVERPVHDAVAVEIDVAAIAGLDAPETLHGVEFADAAVRHDFMFLGVAAPALHALFELARGGVEGIAQGDVRILMGVLVVLVAGHGDLAAGQGDVDVHAEQAALMLVLVRRLDDDAAADDLLTVTVEFRGEFVDAGLQGRRGIHVTEGDL